MTSKQPRSALSKPRYSSDSWNSKITLISWFKGHTWTYLANLKRGPNKKITSKYFAIGTKLMGLLQILELRLVGEWSRLTIAWNWSQFQLSTEGFGHRRTCVKTNSIPLVWNASKFIMGLENTTKRKRKRDSFILVYIYLRLEKKTESALLMRARLLTDPDCYSGIWELRG